jgi:TPR repeat protein
MSKRKTAAVCAFMFLLSLFCMPLSANEDTYDPQFTMLALNMAVVSVYNIFSTQDRVVLDQEYENIINNLKLGNIEDDKEIKDLYDELLNVIFRTKLKEDERIIFKEKYDLRQKKVLYGSLKDFFSAVGYREKEMKISSAAFISNDTLPSIPLKKLGYCEIFTALGKLVATAGSSYFGYRESMSEMHEELGDEIWRLQKEQLEDFDRLQRKLLSSSWSLLRKYRLPDEYRITQRDLEDFSKAVNEQDTNRAVRMFSALEQDFSAYPTFWFFYGRAAKKENNNELEEKCLREFDRVWRPVLRLDPYRLEAAKYKVESLLERHASRDEILEQLRIIRDNAPRENWNAKLFLGVMHFALGDKKQGIEFVEENILFDVEDSLSGLVLRSMRQDKLDTAQLGKELQSALEEWIAEKEKQSMSSAAAAETRLDEQIKKGLRAYLEGKESEAKRVLSPLAETSNNPIPATVLGYMKIDGLGKPRNFAEGDAFFKKRDKLFKENQASYKDAFAQILPLVEKYAAEENARAQFLLGKMFSGGWGLPEDAQKAVSWFHKSAEKGHSLGQYNLGFMYKNGRGVHQDDRKAAEWNRKAAEQGYALAQSNLGWMFMKGEGVPQDDHKAAEWFLKAAEQGYAQAQSILGWMFMIGRGVLQDDHKAVEWFLKAAEQGNAWAQGCLGQMYLDGRAVEQNDREAAELFRKAAYQGDANSQHNLGFMYLNGRGVPEDYKEAYCWFILAFMNGVEESQKEMDKIEGKGFFSLEKLSKEDIEQAKNKAWQIREEIRKQ